MHWHDEAIEGLAQQVLNHAIERVSFDNPVLGRTAHPADLAKLAGTTITPAGLGGPEALRRFTEVLEPACLAVDHPRFLSFIPTAPTKASVLFDLVVSASGIYGGSWMEGAGAVHAENEVLRWLANLAGLPKGAGGVFVAGGTSGNLSALMAARWRWRDRAAGHHDRTRGLVLTSTGAHASIRQATKAMDADVVRVPTDEAGRLTASSLSKVLRALGEDRHRVFAVAATAGTTNAGAVDDLQGAAAAAAELGCWFHVDGAYGLAALLAPNMRRRFSGVEHADSFIVDPHKWLFGPLESCALVYREPRFAKAAHTPQAGYLDVLQDGNGSGTSGWNPSDYAHHLSRRPRGLPLWFSLAAHGTDAYTEAIESTLDTAAQGAEIVRSAPHLELVLEPELSVVLFRRIGWQPADYEAWSWAVLQEGTAMVVPTTWRGETVLRFCVVNPRTTAQDLQLIVDRLSCQPHAVAADHAG